MPLFSCFGTRQCEELEMSHCRLKQFPDSVFRHRRHLQTLVLDGNAIKSLPTNVKRLARLERLSIADNELARLPRELFQNSHLLELNVSDNGLRDLPNAIKHCKRLRTMNLSANAIARIPESVTQLRNLTHLSVNDTSLRFFPSAIDQLSQLVVLEARENFVKMLPKSLGNLSKLRRLDFGANDLIAVPSSIGRLDSLEELWLDANQLPELPTEFGWLSNVVIIDLSDNVLQTLPEHLPGRTSLTDLRLSENRLSKLPDSIGSLENLSVLHVVDNSLETLPDRIRGLKNLTELMLTGNQLTTLPAAVGELTSLSVLNVACNRLESIPPEAGACQSLTILNVRENELTDVPASLSSLTKLRVLDLSSNQLDHLPIGFEQLSLSALWLSEIQSKPLVDLVQSCEAVTNRKVLTCSLLPQELLPESAEEMADLSTKINSKKDAREGLRVAFVPGLAGDSDLTAESSSRLARQPTPYVRDLQKKARRFLGNSDRDKSPNGGEPASELEANEKAGHKSTASRQENGVLLSTLQENGVLLLAEQEAEHRTAASEETLEVKGDVVDETASTNDLKPKLPFLPEGDDPINMDKGADERACTLNPHMQPKDEECLLPAVILTGVQHDRVPPAVEPSVSPPLQPAISKDFVEDSQLPTGIASSVCGNEGTSPQTNGVAVAVTTGTDDGDSEKPVCADDLESKPNSNSIGENLANGNGETELASLAASGDGFPEDEVVLQRGEEGAPLGMSIVGGSDCSATPFGKGEKDSGVFISKIVADSLADKTGKLKMADRILSINDQQLSCEAHSTVVSLLLSTRDIRLRVRHEPLPQGFTIISVVKANGEKLGLKITGGVGCTPGNPTDSDDEGIFVHSVVSGGAVEKNGQLRRGHRIIEVNDQKMLGVSHAQAVNILKYASSPVIFTVCHGFNEDASDEPTEVLLNGASFSDPPCQTAPHENGKISSAEQERMEVKAIIPVEMSHSAVQESACSQQA